ncbi:hypothetical protein Sjap_007682 [Stephania japonica]|uniref:Major facilitator superfamily (MFS) profile domain-containing protein n=1 Tax=Stephania japonica TaxID=461633 RepID=A0AAP0JPQ8_9MAGN
MATTAEVNSSRNREEIKEPLIHQTMIGADEAQSKNKESVAMVYFSTIVAIWGSFEFGSCIGFSSPAQAAISKDLDLSLAEGAVALDIGRLSTGYGMGVFSYVVPIFIAEIAPKDLRGGLTTLNQLMIVCGVSTGYIVGTVLAWRPLALTGLVPCLILLVGLLFVPESPRWLAKMRRQKEFEVALRKLRGKDADISREAAEIEDYIETLQHLPKSNMMDLFQKRYVRSLIIGAGLMCCQQFGGINGVCFYVSQIFVSAGFPSTLGTILYACLQIPVTAMGAALIDRVGRRALLLVHELSLEAVPALAVTGVLLYVGSFSVGMGAIPWVIMSEIYPINIKGVAGSLLTLLNWFISWICSYTFNYLMSWSSYGTFIIYGVVNLLAVFFIAKFVPETKGRTLEEIQASINKS